MNTIAQRAETFRALHAAPGSFVIANAWDAGSAKLLRGLGFPALATSSGAQAGVLGRVDGAVSRDGRARLLRAPGSHPSLVEDASSAACTGLKA